MVTTQSTLTLMIIIIIGYERQTWYVFKRSEEGENTHKGINRGRNGARQHRMGHFVRESGERWHSR